MYKGYTYVFKSKLQCGAEQWICSFRQKTAEEFPEWLHIYFSSVPEKKAMKCNLCEHEIECDPKSLEQLEHIKTHHTDISDLHSNNPDSNVGFRVEFLHLNVLKDDGDIDPKTQPVLLGEVCETTTENELIPQTEEDADNQVISMQYVMLDTNAKKKIKKSGETGGRRRSWIWKYFDKLSNIVYRCNICYVVLSIKGCNTNNLNRHIRSKHLDVFKAEKSAETVKEEFVYLASSDTPDPVKTEEIYASNRVSSGSVGESNSQKQRRSWIWSYFEHTSSTQARCKLCHRYINHGGNATGNMNRHLKMIHHRTSCDIDWVWKVFGKDQHYYTCKICQQQIDNTGSDADTEAIMVHLKKEHGVISGDQIITGADCEYQDN